METLILNGRELTAGKVCAVARRGTPVSIDEQCLQAMRAARETVFAIGERDASVYGLNIGVGANKDVTVASERYRTFNENILRAHSLGMPPYADDETVRAVMCARLNGLLWNCTGIQPAIAQMYMDFLNLRIHPLLPLRGSVGEADITCLPSIGLAMIGEGEVSYGGDIIPAQRALDICGLKRIALGPKDALAILSSNALSGGMAALALYDLDKLIDIADAVYALSIEGIKMDPMHLDARPMRFRPFKGQAESLNNLNAHLQGSYIYAADRSDSQYGTLVFSSGYCVHGSVRDAAAFAMENLLIQLNSSDDCPCVLSADNEIVTSANFEVTTLALAFEMVGVALSHLSKTVCFRIQKLLNPESSGLPKGLAPEKNVAAYSTIGHAMSSLDTEIRHLSNPATADFFAVSQNQEDHASNLPFVIRKVRDIIDILKYMLGVEAMLAAQAVDLRGGVRLGATTEKLHDLIREHIAFLDSDRIISADIKKMNDIIFSDELCALIGREERKP